MHPKLPCRSVVAPTPKLSERQYALRLVVIPCRYLSSPSPSFQHITPSLLSHISSVSLLHLLCHRIHPCCISSPPMCSSTAVFTADIVCHPHYPVSPLHLQCHPPASLLWSSLNYLPLFRVLCRCCLYIFSNQIFYSLCVVLYCTACSALLHTNFLTP